MVVRLRVDPSMVYQWKAGPWRVAPLKVVQWMGVPLMVVLLKVVLWKAFPLKVVPLRGVSKAFRQRVSVETSTGIDRPMDAVPLGLGWPHRHGSYHHDLRRRVLVVPSFHRTSRRRSG